jgi:hypothetical protein
MTIDSGLAALLGALIGAGTSLLGNWLLARYQRNTTTLEAQINFKKQMYEQLQDAFAHIEGLHASFDSLESIRQNNEARKTYGEYIGKAEAACLGVNTPELRKIQEQMTPYITDDFKNVNRTALIEAMRLTGELVEFQSRKKTNS